jgi:hypothetical protein
LITTQELDLADKTGRIWAATSTAPFGMLGPNVMVRAEIIFRRQFEVASSHSYFASDSDSDSDSDSPSSFSPTTVSSSSPTIVSSSDPS